MRGTAASLALLLAACAQPSFEPTPSTDAPREHVMVRFTDTSVRPATAQIAAGGNVTWINDSSEYIGSVVFPASMQAAFSCDDLRPLFSKTGTGYQSIPITSEQTEAVVLPCALRPGSYDYQIYLFEGRVMNPTAGMLNPQLTLPAKLVVRVE